MAFSNVMASSILEWWSFVWSGAEPQHWQKANFGWKLHTKRSLLKSVSNNAWLALIGMAFYRTSIQCRLMLKKMHWGIVIQWIKVSPCQSAPLSAIIGIDYDTLKLPPLINATNVVCVAYGKAPIATLFDVSSGGNLHCISGMTQWGVVPHLARILFTKDISVVCISEKWICLQRGKDFYFRSQCWSLI